MLTELCRGDEAPHRRGAVPAIGCERGQAVEITRSPPACARLPTFLLVLLYFGLGEAKGGVRWEAEDPNESGRRLEAYARPEAIRSPPDDRVARPSVSRILHNA